MGQRFLFKLMALAVAMAMVVLGAGVALADELVNTLDTSVDNQWEQLNLTAGGSAQTVRVKVVSADESGSGSEDGCNIDSAERLVANIENSNTAAVRVSASTLTFTACEQEQSFTVTPLAGGDADITFSQHADTNSGGKYDFHNARFKVAVTGTTKSDQTITFDQPTSPQSYNATFTVSPSASSTLAVSLEASGPCTLSATTAPANVTMTSGTGDCAITASQAGNASFNAATSVTKTVAAQKAAQGPVTVATPSTGTYGDKLSPTASGGSGTGNVTFGATGTACSIPTSGDDTGRLVITSGTGDCSLTATKAGDANYLPRSSAPTAVTIGRAAQDTVTVTGPASGKYNETKNMTSSGGSGDGTVSYSVHADSDACRIESGQLKITSGSGICKISATKAADANFNSSTSAWHTVAVSKNTASMSISGIARTYNSLPQGVTVTTDPANVTGVTVTYNGSSTVPTNAGSYEVVASLTNSNYEGADATATLVISPKAITGDFTADNKEYDGTNAATVLGRTLAGVVQGDTVTLTGGTATFDTAAAANDKVVTLTGYTLQGANGNYTLTSVDTATANITKKNLTGSFTADNKEYDGNRSATVSTTGLTGVVGTDVVSLIGGTATFDTAAAGNGKTVTLTGASLTGGAAGNYNLTSVGTTQANITRKSITGSFTADNKEYDGNRSATVLTTGLTGVVGTDVVSLIGGTATFDTAAAGNGKTVTLSGASLTGGAANNYNLGSVDTATANITKRNVTVTASSPANLIIGAPVPSVTPTYSLLVDGETTATALTALATCGTTYTIDSDVGRYATTCSGAAAANYAFTYVDGAFTVGYSTNGFLQPVNDTRNGQTQSKFKLGSTIPVKFQLLNASSASVQQRSGLPTFSRVKVGDSCDSEVVPESVTATVATTGGSFRWDSIDLQYVYNFSTKGLTTGEWRLKAVLSDGTVISTADVCIR